MRPYETPNIGCRIKTMQVIKMCIKFPVITTKYKNTIVINNCKYKFCKRKHHKYKFVISNKWWSLLIDNRLCFVFDYKIDKTFILYEKHTKIITYTWLDLIKTEDQGKVVHASLNFLFVFIINNKVIMQQMSSVSTLRFILEVNLDLWITKLISNYLL